MDRPGCAHDPGRAGARGQAPGALERDASPASRVAYLGSKEDKDWESPWGKSVRTAAQTLGVTLVPAEFTPHQYTHAFTLISRARADALFVGPNPATYNDRALIVDSRPGLGCQASSPIGSRWKPGV